MKWGPEGSQGEGAGLYTSMNTTFSWAKVFYLSDAITVTFLLKAILRGNQKKENACLCLY